jgi:prevent-host-death family protein
MKAIDEADVRTRLDEILDDAQREPIVILRHGREIAVLLSAA